MKKKNQKKIPDKTDLNCSKTKKTKTRERQDRPG
jgi:hypothetical protein